MRQPAWASSSKPRPRRWTALLGLVVLTAGCGGGVESFSFPDPPSTAAVTATSGPTFPTHLSAISQAAVAGATTTTTPTIGPGGAALNGTVFGPGGPVAGATVEVDRMVGNQLATTTATTAADGSWTVANILGGRYRVRAWQSPSLVMITPQVVFVAGTQSLSMSLQLSQFKGPNTSVAISPAAPIEGEPANLLIQVTNPIVGTDGVLRYPPDAGAQVTLTDGPGWDVTNGNPLTTDAAGNVLFAISCNTGGSDPLSAEVDAQPAVPLQMPLCSLPPTTTTSTTTIPGECPPGATTTTTQIAVPSTTTTTLLFGNCPGTGG